MTNFTPYLSLAGGALIGLAAVLLMALLGRIAGISGMLQALLPPWQRAASDPSIAARGRDNLAAGQLSDPPDMAIPARPATAVPMRTATKTATKPVTKTATKPATNIPTKTVTKPAAQVTAFVGSDRAWRAAFLLGAIVAPAMIWLVTGWRPAFEAPTPTLWLIIGGLIVGVGVQLSSGCTSGHGVCGMARLSGRSIAATLTFMVTTALTVYVIRHLIGGF